MNFYLKRSKIIDGLYLCATTANSSLQTSSIILAAFGWAPSTPLSSCPLATFALSSLCLLTIESLRAFNLPKMIKISQNIGYEIIFHFVTSYQWMNSLLPGRWFLQLSLRHMLPGHPHCKYTLYGHFQNVPYCTIHCQTPEEKENRIKNLSERRVLNKHLV